MANEVGILFNADSFSNFTSVLKEFNTTATGINLKLDKIATAINSIDDVKLKKVTASFGGFLEKLLLITPSKNNNFLEFINNIKLYSKTINDLDIEKLKLLSKQYSDFVSELVGIDVSKIENKILAPIRMLDMISKMKFDESFSDKLISFVNGYKNFVEDIGKINLPEQNFKQIFIPIMAFMKLKDIKLDNKMMLDLVGFVGVYGTFIGTVSKLPEPKNIEHVMKPIMVFESLNKMELKLDVVKNLISFIGTYAIFIASLSKIKIPDNDYKNLSAPIDVYLKLSKASIPEGVDKKLSDFVISFKEFIFSMLDKNLISKLSQVKTFQAKAFSGLIDSFIEVYNSMLRVKINPEQLSVKTEVIKQAFQTIATLFTGERSVLSFVDSFNVLGFGKLASFFRNDVFSQIKNSNFKGLGEAFSSIGTLINGLEVFRNFQKVPEEAIRAGLESMSQIVDLFAGSRNPIARFFLENTFLSFFSNSVFSRLGRIDIRQFSKLKDFAQAVRAFTEGINSLKQVSIAGLTRADFSAIGENLELISEFFSGSNKLTSLFRFFQLPTFGNLGKVIFANKGIFGSLSSFSAEDIEKSGRTLRSISGFINSIKNISSANVENLDLESIQKAISGIAKLFLDSKFFSKSFFSKVSSLDSGALDKFAIFISSLNVFFKAMSGMASLNASSMRIDDSFANDLSKYIDAIIRIIKTDVGSISDSDVKRLDSINKVIEHLFKSIANKDIPQNIKSPMKDLADDFDEFGKKSGDNYASGIQTALQIKSPSRVMKTVGENAAKGFNNGFEEESKSMKGVISGFVDRIKGWFSGLGSSIAGTFNFSNIFSNIDNVGQWIFNVREGIESVYNTIQSVYDRTLGITVEFESAFTGVVKTLDTSAIFNTSGQAGVDTFLANMKDQLMEMATAPDSLVSGFENAFVTLSGIAESAGALGVATENVIGFTEVVGQLSSATDLTAEAGANFLARFTTVTGTTNFEQIGSAIVALGNSTASTESEIAGLVERIAGIATTAGFSEAQTLAYGAAIRSVGIEAELGGSSFNRLIAQINRGVSRGGNLLQAFARQSGMSAQEFSRAWSEDASGTLATFIDGVSELNSVELTNFLDATQLSSAGMSQFLSLMGTSDGVLENALSVADSAFVGFGDTLETYNALQEESYRRTQTAAAQIERLRNNFKFLGDAIGQIGINLFSGALANLSEVINYLSTMIVENTASMTETFEAAVLPVMNLVASIGRVGGALFRIFNLIVFGNSTTIGFFTNVGDVFELIGSKIQMVADKINQFSGYLNGAMDIAERLSQLTPSTAPTEIPDPTSGWGNTGGITELERLNADLDDAIDKAEELRSIGTTATQSHVVLAGESLSAIALRYGTTVEELMRLNNITNPRLLQAGATIAITSLDDATGKIGGAKEDLKAVHRELENITTVERPMVRVQRVVMGLLNPLEWARIIPRIFRVRQSFVSLFSGFDMLRSGDLAGGAMQIGTALVEMLRSSFEIVRYILFDTPFIRNLFTQNSFVQSMLSGIFGTDNGEAVGVIIGDNLFRILSIGISVLTGRINPMTFLMMASVLTDAISQNLFGIGDFFRGSELGQNAADLIGSIATAYENIIRNGLAVLSGDMTLDDFITTTLADVMTVGFDLSAFIADLIKNLIINLPLVIGAMVVFLTPIVGGIWDGIISLIETGLVDPVQVGSFGTALGNFIKAAFGLLVGSQVLTGQLGNSIGRLLSAATNSISTTAGNLATALSTKFAAMFGGLTLSSAAIVAGAIALAGVAVAMIVNEEFRNRVSEEFANFIDSIFGEGTFLSLQTGLSNFVVWAAITLGNLFKSIFTGLELAMVNAQIVLSDGLTNLFNGLPQEVKDFIGVGEVSSMTDGLIARRDALVAIGNIQMGTTDNLDMVDLFSVIERVQANGLDMNISLVQNEATRMLNEAIAGGMTVEMAIELAQAQGAGNQFVLDFLAGNTTISEEEKTRIAQQLSSQLTLDELTFAVQNFGIEVADNAESAATIDSTITSSAQTAINNAMSNILSTLGTSGFEGLTPEQLTLLQQNAASLVTPMQDAFATALSTDNNVLAADLALTAQTMGIDFREQFMAAITSGGFNAENLTGSESGYAQELFTTVNLTAGDTSIISSMFGDMSADNPEFALIGQNIMSGLLAGLDENGGVGTLGTTFGTDFTTGVNESLGIHSPSEVFQNVGYNIIEGLNLGLTENIPLVEGILLSLQMMVTNFLLTIGLINSLIFMSFSTTFGFITNQFVALNAEISKTLGMMAMFGSAIPKGIETALIAALPNMAIMKAGFDGLGGALYNILMTMMAIAAKMEEMAKVAMGGSSSGTGTGTNGGKKFGGNVSAGGIYEVLEGDLPFEIFKTGSRTFFMPNQNGQIYSPANSYNVPSESKMSNSYYNSSTSASTVINVPVSIANAGGMSGSEVNAVSGAISKSVMERLEEANRRNSLTDRLNRRGRT